MRPGSRRRLRPGVLPLLLLVVIVAGCADPSGPAPSPRIELEVRPDSVVPGDSLEVMVSVVNPTGETITLTSMCGGVLYWLEAGVVDGDEDHVRLGGLDQGCFWSVTDVELPPGPGRAGGGYASTARAARPRRPADIAWWRDRSHGSWTTTGRPPGWRFAEPASYRIRFRWRLRKSIMMYSPSVIVVVK